MTFLYRYQGKDGPREGRIAASSEADAYSLLRKSGVRPMQVWPAPGFLNRLSGIGKRGLAIILLSLALVATLSAVLRSSLFAPRPDVAAQPRHQIYGDPALLSQLRETGYAAVFDEEGDRLLACYAQPGVILPNAPTNHAALTAAATFSHSPDDAREIRELKSIVLGMKDELRAYLANGVGTSRTYLERLDERQRSEAEIFRRAAESLKDADDPAEYERVNAALRRIGLKTIPIPAFPSSAKNLKIPH